MPEALTESFCERCGTRYEFKAPTRLNPIRKTRGLVSGLKNYIMSQDALGDAVGDAMRSEQDALAAAQLDAFHTSFNFCIDCRQYTCVNCWNDDAGRCRSCAPLAGTDDLAERLQAGLAPTATLAPTNGVEAHTNGATQLGVEAWPTADLDEVRAGTVEPEPHPFPEPFVASEPEPIAEPEPEPYLEPQLEPYPEPFVAAEPEPQPFTEPEPALPFEPEPEPEPVAAEAAEAPMPEIEPVLADLEPVLADLEVAALEEEVEPEPVPVLGWDTDGDFELIPFPTPAVEEHASIEFAAAPSLDVEEPTWAVDVGEPAAEAGPSLTWAEAPDLSVLVPDPEPEAIGEPAAPAAAFDAPEQLPPATPVITDRPQPLPVDRVAAAAQPTEPEPAVEDPLAAARRAQLDLLGLGDPGVGTLPQGPRPLPYRSSGASVHPAELAARLAAQQATQSPAQTIRASMWDASAREVAGAPSPVGVQNCGGCGLSLSATARFCRRCGTRQAQPA